MDFLLGRATFVFFFSFASPELHRERKTHIMLKSGDFLVDS
jgi:hypothetical protein